MKKLAAILLSIAVVCTDAQADLTEEDRNRLDKEAAGVFAQRHLKEIANAEIGLLNLPREHHDAIMLLASGSISQKATRWREDQSSRQSVDQRTFAYVLSNSLAKLSTLAQRMNLPAISGCHAIEANNLTLLLQYDKKQLANCRPDVYSGVESKLVVLLASEQADAIKLAVNKWATHVVLYSAELSKLEGTSKR